jgi:hypothetical protein
MCTKYDVFIQYLKADDESIEGYTPRIIETELYLAKNTSVNEQKMTLLHTICRK